MIRQETPEWHIKIGISKTEKVVLVNYGEYFNKPLIVDPELFNFDRWMKRKVRSLLRKAARMVR